MNDEKQMIEKRYVGPKDAAALLQVSYATILRWTKKGYVPHLMRPSGKFIYKPEDLQNFYEKKKSFIKK